ncbi:MAG: winged helix-turn-helix transcriptional regulator [Candidatus Hermodarchaeota archaeon]|nr:winged helix-turn-helix transcriptional regulator [Candidatus Hermodarchaeota archaeon]
MDPISKKIIQELMGNCRITYRQMAKKTGITATSVKKRISKLWKNRVISRPYVQLSLAMRDAEISHTDLTTDGTEHDEQLITQLGSHPSVFGAVRVGLHKFASGGNVVGPTGLFELGRFYRKISCVKEVDIQLVRPVGPSPVPPSQLYIYRGQKMTFTDPQLKILQLLWQNARISAKDIGEQTNYSARRVGQILRELQTGGGLYFMVHMRPSMMDSIPFWLIIDYDEIKIEPYAAVKWVYEQFPDAYWNAWLFANKPTIMHFCTAETIRTISDIVNITKEAPFTKQVRSEIFRPQKYFVGPGYIQLGELLGIKVSNHEAEYYSGKSEHGF